MESYDFTIDTTKVKSVTIDGKTSYTLFIRRNEYKLEYFENLILEKDSVGQIEAYIIKYSPSESVEFFKEHGSYSFQGERTIEQLNVGRINFASRSSADCSPIVVTETWCSYDVDHPAGSGCANDGRLYTKTTSYDVGCRQPGGGVSGGNYSDNEGSSYFDDDDYKNYKRIGVKTSPITGTTKADWLMRKLRLTDPELLYFFKTDSELTDTLTEFLHENNTPEGIKFAKETFDIISKGKASLQTSRTEVIKQIKILTNIIVSYGAEFTEFKSLGNYFQDVNSDLSEFNNNELYTYYSMLWNQRYSLQLMRAKTVLKPVVTHLVVPVIEMALFEVGGTVALKVLQKIPFTWVLRGTRLTGMIQSVISLGVKGNQAHIRIISTSSPLTRARGLFNALTKNAIKIANKGNGTLVADMGNGNFITFRLTSKSGFPATIDLNFPRMFTEKHVIKFLAP